MYGWLALNFYCKIGPCKIGNIAEAYSYQCQEVV